MNLLDDFLKRGNCPSALRRSEHPIDAEEHRGKTKTKFLHGIEICARCALLGGDKHRAKGLRGLAGRLPSPHQREQFPMALPAILPPDRLSIRQCLAPLTNANRLLGAEGTEPILRP